LYFWSWYFLLILKIPLIESLTPKFNSGTGTYIQKYITIKQIFVIMYLNIFKEELDISTKGYANIAHSTILCKFTHSLLVGTLKYI
jgi:hypothetical protein